MDKHNSWNEIKENKMSVVSHPEVSRPKVSRSQLLNQFFSLNLGSTTTLRLYISSQIAVAPLPLLLKISALLSHPNFLSLFFTPALLIPKILQLQNLLLAFRT